MLFSVEQAFVGRDEIQAPLKTPAWEASGMDECQREASEEGSTATVSRTVY